MIESLLVFGLWPLGIFGLVQAAKLTPVKRWLGDWLPVLPILIGALSGPWGAPWVLADTGSIPPAIIGVIIGAGAGLCSQGIYEWYERQLRRG